MTDYLTLVAGDPEPLDTLCRHCLCPAMVRVPVYALTDDSVARVAIWTGCIDCAVPDTDPI